MNAKFFWKAFKFFAWGAAGFLIALFLYYLTAIHIARSVTPGLVARILSSPQAVLNTEDFSRKQFDELLAVEDPSFFEHHGIDFKTPGQGITTLTQGLAKQLYFNPFRPGISKLRLILLARFALDPLVSKDDQLRLFVNRVYLGNVAGKSVEGFEDAAQAYYRKSFKQLSDGEYLSLVAMVIAPDNFSVLKHPAANAERVRRIRLLLSGEYKPKGLMDLYYGPLDEETQKGLPAASYFPGLYK
jgi:membrane carboxypeptidase/penicillin-binding protein